MPAPMTMKSKCSKTRSAIRWHLPEGAARMAPVTTRLYTHPACLDHDMGPGHPERPARLEAILAALQAPAFAPLEWHEASRAAIDQIARAHPQAFVEAVLAAVPRTGRVMLDGHGILSLQQCRRRGASGAQRPWFAPDRGDGFRCPSRQWHPGHVRGG